MTVCELGLEMHLGHDGKRCRFSSGVLRNVVVVHERGQSTLKVGFCQCKVGEDGETVPEPLQLLAEKLWPGSWKQPRTAFTFGVLDMHELLSRQATISTQDFYQHLRRRTNGTRPDTVDVSVRMN